MPLAFIGLMLIICPEHERSVATIDAMKSKSSKTNNSTVNYKNFTPREKFLQPKSPLFGGQRFLIFPPHQYSVNDVQYSESNRPEV